MLKEQNMMSSKKRHGGRKVPGYLSGTNFLGWVRIVRKEKGVHGSACWRVASGPEAVKAHQRARNKRECETHGVGRPRFEET